MVLGMTPLQILTQRAALRHGVVDRAAVIEAGLSSDQLKGLTSRGVLERVAYRTYVFPAVPRDWHQAVLIATTTAGDLALASHQTAAFLHGLVDRKPPRIEVVMPRWNRAHQEFVVHESTDLAPEDSAEVSGIPVTTPVRTVVDLGASAPWLVESALDRGLRTRSFTLEGVAALVGRVARRGRRGVGVIRPFVEQRLHWDGVTESELEDLFRRSWGLRTPQPTPQVEIRNPDGTFVCRADFAFIEHRLRIELDSEAFHMDRPTFRRDRVIQNQTELLGWRTLRYTWWDLIGRPDSVVAEVLAAIHQAA